MASITFSSDNLRKLLRVNSYNFPQTGLMVFGIRGATPVGSGFDTFKTAHSIEQSDPNFTNPRCIIGIWKPVDNKIALYPGSTVPHLKYIKKHKEGTAKANCMMTGFYSFYEKGFHFPSEGNAHQALRLATNIALRRSTNDLVFGNDDPVEVGNPNDNLHAAYCNDASGEYSSAGCQVIVGQPKCKNRGANSTNTSFWKKFHDTIYETGQQRFDYALFRYADADAVAAQGNNLMQARLRFGSKGNVVQTLQSKLAAKGFFITIQDGDFGRNTLRAVLDFQTQTFGVKDADGVVGNGTATALGFTLPMI
jgi:Putative peptidoglycan binding domain